MTQQKLGSYLSLCTQFYDLIRPEPPEDAYAFYRSYVSNAVGSILEPMCGTGRFLLPLLQEGFNVHGFDASEHMLEALHTKAALKHLHPTVWHGFVEDLTKTEKYGLIFIPSGAFGHIIDLDSVKQSLKIMYDHLSKDGILVFEAESSKSVPSSLGIWRGVVCHKPDGKMIIVNRLTMLEDSVCHWIDRYELVDGSQIIQTEIETFNVRLYDDSSVLINMLKTISKAITDLRQTLSVNPEFKFSKTHPTVKDRFFDELCQYDFEVRVLVVDKSNIYSQKLRNDTDSFYNYFVKMLMQYDDDVLQNASIKIDGSGDKEFKKALTAYLRQRIGEHKIKKFKFTDSRKDNLIQLADMVVGAVARSYSDTRKDANRWLEVLKRRDKIKSIWDFK